MDPTPLKPDATLQLGPAQRHLCHAAAGSVLVVEEGLVLLDGPPRWLSAQMLTPRRQVEAGCCHVLEEDGWIGLTAPRGARLRLLAERGEGTDDGLLALLLARVRWLRTLENRLLAAGVAALRLRLERREN